MTMAVQAQPAYRSTADSVQLFQPFMGLEPDEFKALAASILIVIPHRPSEGVNKSLFRNAGIWGILGTPTADVSDEFEGFVEMTRGGIVRTFLQYAKDNPAIEYCVMIDNDEAVDWDAPYRLAQWGKKVVSGIVCSFSERKGGIFACVTVKDDNGIARFPTVKKTKKLPSQGLKEIESAGTGLLCVHKSVFQEMLDSEDNPFMIPEEVRQHCCATGTLKLGEDMAFSERCRKRGIKMYVDFSVRAEHFKTLSIQWPKELVDSHLDPRTWKVANDDYVHV
jgi:hypothetical protein